jgi:hypothetical protein
MEGLNNLDSSLGSDTGCGAKRCRALPLPAGQRAWSAKVGILPFRREPNYLHDTIPVMAQAIRNPGRDGSWEVGQPWDALSTGAAIHMKTRRGTRRARLARAAVLRVQGG